jgi:hypothetical protein
MNNKGLTGFGLILILLLIFAIGYSIHQLARVHVNYGAIREEIKEDVEIGLAQSDEEITRNIINKAKERDIRLDQGAIYIDHSDPDTFRIYVTYRDSSSFFDFFYYKREFEIDERAPIKVRYY